MDRVLYFIAYGFAMLILALGAIGFPKKATPEEQRHEQLADYLFACALLLGILVSQNL